jgi:hypothetical protein
MITPSRKIRTVTSVLIQVDERTITLTSSGFSNRVLVITEASDYELTVKSLTRDVALKRFSYSATAMAFIRDVTGGVVRSTVTVGELVE